MLSQIITFLLFGEQVKGKIRNGYFVLTAILKVSLNIRILKRSNNFVSQYVIVILAAARIKCKCDANAVGYANTCKRLKIARESRVESVALDCIRHYDDDDDETDGGNNHNNNDDEENEDDNEDDDDNDEEDDDRETSEVSLVRTLRSICCESIVWLTHVRYAINVNCKKRQKD